MDNLEALASCQRLESLNLGYSRCFDLAPLAACSCLRSLHLHKSSLVDTSCLKALGAVVRRS